MDTVTTVTVGASAAAEMWIVELDVLDGHIRMMKGSGSDRFVYIEPCSEQVEEPDRDPPTPVPGVGGSRSGGHDGTAESRICVDGSSPNTASHKELGV